MAGEIDLFSGNDPVAGINLFKVDKNPMDRLDQGIAGMVAQAEGIGGALTDLIQQIIDSILGWAGGGLADLANFFLNLGPNFVKLIEDLTGLNIDQGPVVFIQSLFTKLEAATGLNWDEGPVRFLNSLFEAIFSQFERLTGLSLGDGPVSFFNSIFLKLEAATGLDWNGGPLAFLASLFDGIWTQLNILTELVWDEGPLAFLASLFNKVITELERLTGLEINSGVGAFLNSLWLKLNEATQLVWNSGPVAFLTSLFNAVINEIERLTGLEINSGVGAFLNSLWLKLNDATGLIWNSGVVQFLSSLFNTVIGELERLTGLEINSGVGAFLTSLYGRLNTLTGLVWTQGPGPFLNSLVNWVINNIFNPNGAANVFNAIRNFVAQFFDPTKGPLSGIFFIIKAITDVFFTLFPWLNPGQIPAGTSAVQTTATISDAFPPVSAFVGAVTGQSPSDDVDLGLGTLQQWAREIEEEARKAGDTLQGFISDLLSGTLSIGMLNTTQPNLMAQGEFGAAATITPGGGWTWDNTISATATGGSARVIGDGSLQQLYSHQTISVAPGDKIEVAAKVRTSAVTGETFVPAAGRSMVLSIIPWAGTSRLTSPAVHIVHSRTTTSPGAWADMTGPIIVIGGTAGAGEVVLPSNVTSIQVRLAVTANANAKINFDEIVVRKTGLVSQGWVDKLQNAWGGVYNAVFNLSGGNVPSERTYTEFVSALAALDLTSGQAFENAGFAQTDIRDVIKGVGQAVYGTGRNDSSPPTVLTNLQHLMLKLFGFNFVQNTLTDGAIPSLDGSIIKRGTVASDRIDVPGVGRTINPGIGSGAMLTRTLSSTHLITGNTRKVIEGGFFNNAATQTSDIAILAGNTGFRVSNAGWYMVEIAYKLNGVASWGWNFAPVLFKNGAAFKTGTDCMYTWGGHVGVGLAVVLPGSSGVQRYVQNSFIVYLGGQEFVQAGYTNQMGLNFGDTAVLGGGTPEETYCSISLLNRTF